MYPMPDQNVGFNDENMPQGNFPAPNNNIPSEEENPYDSNFNPEVGVDEEENPKKFIQQLTGKLSQSLRKYQENQESDDKELAKYVAGMVLKSASLSLDKKDVKTIIDKLNDNVENNEDDINLDFAENGDNEENDNEEQETSQTFDGKESYNRFLSEITNDLSTHYNKVGKVNRRIKQTKNYKSTPFTAPDFQ